MTPNVKVQYPYYLGSKILGADLYSSIDYLLKFKNKKLIFDGDNIKTSHLVVSIKTEIEKIREQVQNIL